MVSGMQYTKARAFRFRSSIIWTDDCHVYAYHTHKCRHINKEMKLKEKLRTLFLYIQIIFERTKLVRGICLHLFKFTLLPNIFKAKRTFKLLSQKKRKKKRTKNKNWRKSEERREIQNHSLLSSWRSIRHFSCIFGLMSVSLSKVANGVDSHYYHSSTQTTHTLTHTKQTNWETIHVFESIPQFLKCFFKHIYSFCSLPPPPVQPLLRILHRRLASSAAADRSSDAGVVAPARRRGAVARIGHDVANKVVVGGRRGGRVLIRDRERLLGWREGRSVRRRRMRS